MSGIGGLTVSVNAGMLMAERPGDARWTVVDSSNTQSQTMVTFTKGGQYDHCQREQLQGSLTSLPPQY